MEISGKETKGFDCKVIADTRPVKDRLAIESLFSDWRKKTTAEYFYSFCLHSKLSRQTVKNLESENSYFFSSLWKYLFLLIMQVFVADFQELASDIVSFGKLMKRKRMKENLPINEIFQKNLLFHSTIKNIEKGIGHSRNIFLRYISVFNILNFPIKIITY
jgi:hypothetical protein